MKPDFRSPVLWLGVVTLAVLPLGPRAAFPLAIAWSFAWLNSRDRSGTFATLYVVLLLILGILATLLAGLGLLHRWISG